jgi:REP element-mobilizing transposase RayT
MPFPGHRVLRKGRASLPGQVYPVTVVSRERQRHFANFAAACAVASVLGDATAWRDARAMAWVLMPDHWHALVQLGEVNSLSAAMQRINSLTARAAGRRRRTHGRPLSGGESAAGRTGGSCRRLFVLGFGLARWQEPPAIAMIL